ncbi:adenine nucleotide alpha hydrolase family protein [candidate division WOR-3 bacterium]|nr:adenine nucleotide alpha hydrolase family protein [candidate division WOR-3 bacterium]
MSWITSRVARLVHRSIGTNRVIADGERLVVAVSGGADSFCLLHLFESLNRKGRRNWDLRAVHVDPGFDGWSSLRVVRTCRAIGVDCDVVHTDVPAEVGRTGQESCYICARARRKALLSWCDEAGSSRLALAHNLDDVNETFVMNLLYTSSARTILPVQPLFGGRLIITRPLYYVDKDLVRRYARSTGLRAVRNRCPYERLSSRGTVRRLLQRLYTEDPRIRNNLFAGLHNLKSEYLPRPRRAGDVRL